MIRALIAAPKTITVHAIQLYQRTVSPDTGFFSVFFPHGYCRFHPTCSEYTRQAIIRYGFLRGGVKGTWRVLRCNPWNKGGIDQLL